MAIGSITLMFVASLAATPYAQQKPVRVGDQDSIVVLRGELQRVAIAQQALSRDLRVASTALRRAGSDAERSNYRSRVSELSARLERTLNDAAALQAHLRAMCAAQPAPEGWLGINISEAADISASPSATSIVYRKYPVVVSVEPGSPAQKAGLLSGDELLALGGNDMVSRPVDVAVLLKPGVSLPVRYRRDGELRNINVTVEPRPENFHSGCPWIEITPMPVVAAGRAKVHILELPNGGIGYTFTDSSGPRILGGAQVRGTPVLPPTPHVPLRMQATVAGANIVVFGAVLMPLNEDLREGLGIDEGILVFDVLRGSLAGEAGLRAGDVITRVNGRKVQSIMALISAFDEAGDREVELQVSSRRSAKPRTVLLRP